MKHGDSAYSGFCVFVAMAVRTRRVKLCVNVDLRYTLYLNFEMRVAGFIIYTHAVTARNFDKFNVSIITGSKNCKYKLVSTSLNY